MAERECQLTPEQLRRTFDPQALGIATTEHLQPLEWIIGQARAVSALRFGLGIEDVGFHVYVAGPPGSGKMTALRTFLEEVAQRKEPPADWCYVYNFEDPYQIQEHMQEMITRGTLFIDTTGQVVGQVNGLSVLSLGDYLFGRPSRITASVGPGREGIIDIEREVSLGGPLHSKGILILSGYLAQHYAQDKPLTLGARLVFEQSYEGVEGDSASSAELYALLSALSGVPIKQGIAVTGSVNQHGEVQAIGGVNQKIEGFFDVCQAKGLMGEQGVLIPHSNVPHLMLREDVVEAATAGQFHVWAVKTIDEGIAMLTGIPPGVRDAAGRFPAGTLNERVDRRLREFAECLKAFQAVGATACR